ncbi:hypothetical protein GGTG_00532 [Gaeumannomyces tritici R3-111a-1]|uniref:Uncharacterized protein n=1 Tax=Gaeumannomyces tritici (strain R3-111a-1) TaxID=644352 RepID=J3NGZ6_GAET3|nr:hypothetical protein GGTG_00532 [Gaeumannomyces tritici R3-111a-1]EJT80536.1 hypothetical protein GGTG_00532 [Gaeumannomyces tritici R3-111a-1]
MRLLQACAREARANMGGEEHGCEAASSSRQPGRSQPAGPGTNGSPLTPHHTTARPTAWPPKGTDAVMQRRRSR